MLTNLQQRSGFYVWDKNSASKQMEVNISPLPMRAVLLVEKVPIR